MAADAGRTGSSVPRPDRTRPDRTRPDRTRPDRTRPDRTLLIQFARSPQPGRVKTRMMPHLSAQQACDLHCELLLWTARQLLDSGQGDVQLAVAGSPLHAIFRRCAQLGALELTRQSGRDLGERMYRALRRGLENYAAVVLVGSDCPGIDARYLREAADALRTRPVVLGPAVDGGYVLIGARQICPELFAGVAWGSERVYAQTVQRMRRLGLAWAELAPQVDVDRPADLPAWYALRDGAGR
ncbi:MAG: TIGR04282 family arsenosugar biosynthesis glycosyltransferase [Halioglobus sp.]|nr:TIGR04282 family arsenosugar biosynthesis glycosyltransferase [Halioglobus sp.]